jgi:hypothetical protein
LVTFVVVGLLVTAWSVLSPIEPPVKPPNRPVESLRRPQPSTPRVEKPPEEPAPEACPEGCVSSKPGCVIKGNISLRTGERIYHLPGQRYYDRTVISPENGERWFCTQEEAVANGWRRAKV